MHAPCTEEDNASCSTTVHSYNTVRPGLSVTLAANGYRRSIPPGHAVERKVKGRAADRAQEALDSVRARPERLSVLRVFHS